MSFFRTNKKNGFPDKVAVVHSGVEGVYFPEALFEAKTLMWMRLLPQLLQPQRSEIGCYTCFGKRRRRPSLGALFFWSNGPSSSCLVQVFPEHKYEIVKKLQESKHIVGMTGDGVNDAPALKKAYIGIAVANATDAARGASDIVLTEPVALNYRQFKKML